MKILSFYLGFPSTVSIYVNGKIVAAVHEERYSRRKNDEIFPMESIKYCLEEANLTAEELDGVAISSEIGASFDVEVTRKSQWSVKDYLKEQREIWKPKLYGEKVDDNKYLEIFADKVDTTIYPSEYYKSLINDENRIEKHNQNRKKIIADYLKIDEEKVYFIEHHRCHSHYSYYASPFRKEKVLSFTIDGMGDGLNATIGIYDENGKYKRVYETSEANIGRIYRYMTLNLGMKPNEHEFKVMGLAPYGKAKYGQEALDIFNETLYIDGIDFKWHKKPTDSYYYFRDKLEGIRFDNVAWGLQTWVENLLTTWVKNAINKFGINKVIFSGGVAMNIKAMGEIAKLPEVEDIFVGGSASDESMAISAGICLAEDMTENWNSKDINPIENLYLGPKATLEEEKQTIDDLDKSKYIITDDFSSKDIAQYLANGKVLARCADRMEFGQRSLGNRSLLADPKNIKVKETINSMIKNRDFWMPFAPIVMDKYVDKYLVNPKNLVSKYMTIGFDTTKEGYEAMSAACHPADKSARPEMLSKELNPVMYEIMEEFEKLTGRGAVLNTSFNLHGYPIVNTPKEAVCVLENSGLDGIILNNYLVLKVD
jgi:carbamoyltransferase